MKGKKFQHFSRYTNEVPSVVEWVIETKRNLLKKPVFEKRNVIWLSELPSVIKQNNNTFHHSIKMTPVQASKKSNEKEVCSNLQDQKVRQQPNITLGQLVRAADIKKVFPKGDSSNWSYNLYTKTEVIHDTLPSYQIDFLPEIYNQNLLLQTKLTLDENNQNMKKLNLIQ